MSRITGRLHIEFFDRFIIALKAKHSKFSVDDLERNFLHNQRKFHAGDVRTDASKARNNVQPSLPKQKRDELNTLFAPIEN